MSHPVMRKCSFCGAIREKSLLYRFVKDKDESIIWDKFQTAPGRGAYLCRKNDCLKKAEKKASLQRSLKAKGAYFFEIPKVGVDR
ncbi:MAG: YlxR family protein [Lachnospiraceae bacterium]|nr:YlxR family protein [Lachnospiraceae bacterium]